MKRKLLCVLALALLNMSVGGASSGKTPIREKRNETLPVAPKWPPKS